MGERVTIKEAAERLGVSADTIRRRLKAGELQGERQKTPQGFIWLISLPEDAPSEPTVPREPKVDTVELMILHERLAGLERLLEERGHRVNELEAALAAEREAAISEREASAQLRVLLQQAQTLAGAVPASVGHQTDTDFQAALPRRSKESFWDRLLRRSRND
jgi:hypothetical protein